MKPKKSNIQKIRMYYHSGSANHGCEAIVRSSKKILNSDVVLYSFNIDEDEQYGIDEIAELQEDKDSYNDRNRIEKLYSKLMHKFRKDDFIYYSITHRDFFEQVNKGDIYLSIGGDNYCYSGKDILGYYNKRLHQKGAKTVLWGCSFEPGDMTPEISEDIKRYDLIVARESISYEALRRVNPNTVLYPDPAFLLDIEKQELPESFRLNNTIGINISPLVERLGRESIILQNYRELIKFIIEKTDFYIALIPHVVKKFDDDRIALRRLYDEFKESGRVLMIDDCNCMQLKGYISRCRMFIGARTHSTIAAYSTCVPTLVVGYSVKSIGIARDLFGSEEHYVISAQDIKDIKEITKAFEWLLENEDGIRRHLRDIIPDYKERLTELKSVIKKL